jgi:catechol 2,3-dioxygenase-like lactoylglutathione lyase family enzyme
MALRGLELHHHAIRVRPGTEDETVRFFGDVLGLARDPETRAIPDVPTHWMDAGRAQIHLFAVDGVSTYARTPERDPFTPHVALGVPDIVEAKAELERLGVEHWRVGRDERQQVFVNDPSGNMIELHQIGTCRCDRTDR